MKTTYTQTDKRNAAQTVADELAALAVWFALCALLAVVALGFVGFFD